MNDDNKSVSSGDVHVLDDYGYFKLVICLDRRDLELQRCWCLYFHVYYGFSVFSDPMPIEDYYSETSHSMYWNWKGKISQ